MKKDIHPPYYSNAKVICVCGNKFTVGATVPEIKVEICSKCHPFYTGAKSLIDTAGRVERFKARRRAAEASADEARTRRTKTNPPKPKAEIRKLKSKAKSKK